MRASGTRRTGRSPLPVSAPSNRPAGPRAGHRNPGSLARGARRPGRQRQVDVRGAPFRPGRGAFLRRLPRAPQRGRGRSADHPNRVLDPSSRSRPTSRGRPVCRRRRHERRASCPASPGRAGKGRRRPGHRHRPRPAGRSRACPEPARKDRVVDPSVVDRHVDRLARTLGDGGLAGAGSSGISGEGFAAVHVLRSAPEVDDVVLERRRLEASPTSRR